MVGAREAVENGVTLLDREIPGWDEEINLPSLDIGNCRQCVMGQLFGLYSTGVARLGVEDGELYGLNFDYFRDVMNPSAKAAGLSFQLSSPPKRDGLLTDDGATIGYMTIALISWVRKSVRTQTAKTLPGNSLLAGTSRAFGCQGT